MSAVIWINVSAWRLARMIVFHAYSFHTSVIPVYCTKSESIFFYCLLPIKCPSQRKVEKCTHIKKEGNFAPMMYGECLNGVQIWDACSLKAGSTNGSQWIRLSGKFKSHLHETHLSQYLVFFNGATRPCISVYVPFRLCIFLFGSNFP